MRRAHHSSRDGRENFETADLVNNSLPSVPRFHATRCSDRSLFVASCLSILREEARCVRGLARNDELRFGEAVQLRFRQPHPLSATARLEFISHHRTQPSTDGVLLMSGSCILGPSLNSHVICRQWEDDLVLVRQGQTLACHFRNEFEVDGQACQGRAAVTLESTIQGDDFCLSIERID